MDPISKFKSQFRPPFVKCPVCNGDGSMTTDAGISMCDCCAGSGVKSQDALESRPPSEQAGYPVRADSRRDSERRGGVDWRGKTGLAVLGGIIGAIAGCGVGTASLGGESAEGLAVIAVFVATVGLGIGGGIAGFVLGLIATAVFDCVHSKE